MNQVPAYLLKRNASTISDEMIAGISAGMPPHLSIAENRFTLVDAGGFEKVVPTFHLDVCVIGSNDKISRIFFDPSKPFDPKRPDGVPPLCWSDNGIGPSKQSSLPQSPTCAVCPHAEWGSAISKQTGKGVPACQSGKKLAFIVPGDADNIVYMFKVPPASLKNLQAYVKTLASNTISKRKASPPDVITRLEFDGQGIVKFTPSAVVDEDTFNRTELAYSSNIIAQITGRDDLPIDPTRQLAPPVATNALAGPAPQRAAPPPPQTNPVFDQPHRQQVIAPPAAAPKSKATPKVTPADALEIPGFLKRSAPPVQTVEVNPNAAQFGMVKDAPAPSGEVNDALKAAFNLPGL
jgi:hypothetical protein